MEKQAVKKPTNIEEANYERTIWQVMPESTVEVESLLKPEYWAHVAKRFKAGDRIEAVPEDRHYFAEFFVLGAAANWAKVILLRKVVLIKDNESTVEEGFKVAFAGKHKWRVTQGSEILSKDHDDKVSAENWLEEHRKEMRL